MEERGKTWEGVVTELPVGAVSVAMAGKEALRDLIPSLTFSIFSLRGGSPVTRYIPLHLLPTCSGY
jgi:hypothetical protein